MRFSLILGLLLMSFVANAQYLHMLERADSSSRKVVVTNNSGIQRYVEVDSLATLLGVNGSVDSIGVIQDTILVYFRSGSELGRDTIGTYNKSQIDSKDALRVLYTDTAAMLLPYITEVEVNDTLSVYYLSTQVDSADALRVLYTDTASMLSSYTRRTELQDTASAIRNDLEADIGAKTDTTAFNQVELTYNPNSQPILNKHYREVDKQTIYIEEINNAAQGVSRLLNTTLSSGRNAYQDAEVVWIADNSDSTVTYSNKGADFTLSRNGNIYGKDNEGEWFEWLNDYPNIDFQENKQKAGLRLFSYIDYGFYRSRVEADTGTLYSIDTCTQNKIDMSLSSSITMIPDGAKAGKLYSIFPNDGSGDFSVVRATTATRVNADGLIEEVAANVPRIDHTNGCPDLLIEPQRTNLLTYSEEFDNAAWVKDNSSITANTAISPDGTTNADKLVEDSANNFHRLRRFVVTISNSTNYSFYIFAKADERNFVVIRSDIEGSNRNATFNLSTGDITFNGFVGSAFIEDFDDGWYKCGVNVNSGDTSATLSYCLSDADVTDNNIPSYTGDGTSGIYLWGAQLEEGSYPTSYIPTEGTSVTRNADEIELTGAADLLGDSEGTLFVEYMAFNIINDAISISDGGLNNSVAINASTNFVPRVVVGGVVEATITSSTPFNDNTFYKTAWAYKTNDFAFAVGGSVDGADNSGSTFSDGTLTDIQFNFGNGSTSIFYGRIRQLAIFPTRLTNTQLENLTQ